MDKPFISLQELPEGPIKWIDCRFSLQDPEAGRTQYEAAHVAGAIYWNLETDLSDMASEEGRHPMPSHSALQVLFERSGLHQDDFIILYDNGGEPFATRGWFMLTYAGFNNAFILRDGWEQLKNHVPVDASIPEPVRTNLTINWKEDIRASKETVKAIVSQEKKRTLVDARSEERYLGESEPIDAVAGHIPSAINYNWELLRNSGRFQDGSLEDLTKNVPDVPLTVYCGSGVTASPLFAMLKQAGYKDVQLYVGSYSDWIRSEDIEIGRPKK